MQSCPSEGIELCQANEEAVPSLNKARRASAWIFEHSFVIATSIRNLRPTDVPFWPTIEPTDEPLVYHLARRMAPNTMRLC